jgi:NADH-quinone oxidoreductase subunit M
MIALILILIPLLTGIISFSIQEDKKVRTWAYVSSVLTVGVALFGLISYTKESAFDFKAEWMGSLGSSFHLKMDGLSKLMCLLTAVAYPLIFISTLRTPYKNPNRYFGLMLLMQAGLFGVFVAADALLFYFFWELALIPAYFLCSTWGGERRIAVTFKFFVYTFLGSVLMLIALLSVYNNTPGHSFDIESFYRATISGSNQNWIFWMMFVAFAIKMPIFPFHTWQPDTYEQTNTGTTMVLSGLMVKMGLFAVLRWLLPVMPFATANWTNAVAFLCVFGIIYASLIAIQQDDLKRLVAYSSIAHIGLMCLTLFAVNRTGIQGVMLQMFNHGINIIGLWIVVEIIERNLGVKKISQLGGLATTSPALAIFLTIIALANIALPLTNGFPGEFLMFNGVFNSNAFDGDYTLFGSIKFNASSFGILFTVLAGLGIILAAVYTLNMIRKVFYGDVNELTAKGISLGRNEKIVLSVIVVLILVIGVYPKPLLDMTQSAADFIMSRADVSPFLKK